MMRSVKAALLILIGFLAGCSDMLKPGGASAGFDPGSDAAVISAGGRYVIVASGTSLPAGLAAAVQRSGGQLTGSLDLIGVALAVSSDPLFAERAARIAGIQGVAPDLEVRWTPRDPAVSRLTLGETDLRGSGVGDAETFAPIQWVPGAVSAPAAWNAGAQGAGARVAVLDGGIWNSHLDLAPNLDAARSVSFVPGQAYNADVGSFWHGTHAAGVVAAAAQGLGTAGIAPQATIVGVKVLHDGIGSFSALIQGVLYAATPTGEGGAGADVINMSLGAMVPRNGQTTHLFNALGRATQYAAQRGVTLVASAGNDGVNLDRAANWFFLPAEAPGVLAVSATGPRGFALGAADFDRPASYTNYGKGAVSFAAPGGDYVFEPASSVCSMPALPGGSVSAPCWVFDMVIAPCRGEGTSTSTYCWGAGTSMASSVVSGVAALIIGRYGRMPPAQVWSRLVQSADDLGEPGRDDYYGLGRVNAIRAVQ